MQKDFWECDISWMSIWKSYPRRHTILCGAMIGYIFVRLGFGMARYARTFLQSHSQKYIQSYALRKFSFTATGTTSAARTTQPSICFSERHCLLVLKINFFAENQCKISFLFLCIDLKNSVRRLIAGVNFCSAKNADF